MHEDLTGFLERVMTEVPVSPDGLIDALWARFSMVPEREMVVEALDHLVFLGRAVREGDHYRLVV
jgi:hypothetical protein